jgi:hypothetical protein
MAWLKGFVSSICSFVRLLSAVGSGIIVLAFLMTSTANAATITGLAPDPLYLLPNASDELIVTINEPAAFGDVGISLSSDGGVIVPATVYIPQGETTAPIMVTSGPSIGEAMVWASLGASNAGAHIIITENIPSVPIPGAAWLLGSGLLGLGLLGGRRKRG